MFPKFCCTDAFIEQDLKPDPTGATALVSVTNKRWRPGEMITVGNMGGDQGQREEAKHAAKIWMKYANIEFVFDVPNPVIRISYDASGGAWSMVGTDARNVSRNRPTMNLGFNSPGTYLHEFGHALGFVHEHQHPETKIRWNEQAVLRDAGGPPNNWDLATIRANIFDRYSKSITQFSQEDPKSIMRYWFPRHWILEGDVLTSPNSELSKTDIEYARYWYPFDDDDPTKPPGEGNTDPAICADCTQWIDVIGDVIDDLPKSQRFERADRKLGGRLKEIFETIKLIQDFLSNPAIKEIIDCAKKLTLEQRLNELLEIAERRQQAARIRG